MNTSQFFRRWLWYTIIESFSGSVFAFMGGVFLVFLANVQSNVTGTEIREPALITGTVFAVLVALFLFAQSIPQWRIERESFESKSFSHFVTREYPKWVYDETVRFELPSSWVGGFIFSLMALILFTAPL